MGRPPFRPAWGSPPDEAVRVDRERPRSTSCLGSPEASRDRKGSPLPWAPFNLSGPLSGASVAAGSCRAGRLDLHALEERQVIDRVRLQRDPVADVFLDP